MLNPNFQVEVIDDTDVSTHKGNAKIRITSNGYQWMSFANISDAELLQIKKEITRYLKAKKEVAHGMTAEELREEIKHAEGWND